MKQVSINAPFDDIIDNCTIKGITPKTTNEFLVQIDCKPYKQKPDGKEMAAIKFRTQKSEPRDLTGLQLVNFIRRGYSFSPGVLKGGLGAKNWVQQQLFGVDIDNSNKDMPLLTVNNALKICLDKGISPLLYYESYSHTAEKPKFRLVFAMDEPVFEEAKRLIIIETLISLFPQADTACTDACRIFFGTNKGVYLL